MNIFYAPPAQIKADVIELTNQEATHASKSLRYKVGDEIIVVDGVGGWYEGEVQLIADQLIHVLIKKVEKAKQSQPNIILGMGIIKKRDRLEFAVEKAVELGVKEIALFNSEHTVKQNVRIDRLESITRSAMKQSLQAWLPVVRVYKSPKQLIDGSKNKNIIVAHEEEKRGWDALDTFKKSETLLLVGPEGGFSAAEMEYFNSYKAKIISLGENRLRTETAAITLLNQLKFYCLNRL